MIAAFDIETRPSTRALALEPDETFLLSGVRDNFKPETVERYKAENLAKWPEEVAKRASLDWRLGEIAAASIGVCGDKPLWTGVVVPEGGGLPDLRAWPFPNEGLLLASTWKVLAEVKTLVGFCLRDFDLPWLIGRSAVNRIAPSRHWNTARYSHGDVIDWADILSGYNPRNTQGWSLTAYAQWFGLPPVTGTGAEVWPAIQDGDYALVVEHVESDVRATMALHELFAPAYGFSR